MSDDEILNVDSLDLEGQGVARRANGKVVFVEGALPGERVNGRVTRRKGQWEQATVSHVLRESAQRVRPRCPHFGLHPGACGGCKLQHLEPAAQVAVKQRVLEDNLWHLAKLRPGRVLPPLHGPAWGYRMRARLSVRYVQKKDAVLVGFHERKSRYVADMHTCPVLHPKVSDLLDPLRQLVLHMEARSSIPQIEVAVGEGRPSLVLRHLQPLSEPDRESLSRFAAQHGVQWWLQPAGPQSAVPLHGAAEDADASSRPVYRLAEFGLEMPFKPTEFTQVNAQINASLVKRAIRLLQPAPEHRIIDWFCGLGNFTLPIAMNAANVLGLEGSAALVERARENAQLNRLSERTRFEVQDLFSLDPAALLRLGPAHGWLIDPPREGAFALVKALADLFVAPEEGAPPVQPPDAWAPPERIVYVSCNPSTLARDAGLLVHRAGYTLSQAGIANMFPHTAHVESVAVFERDRARAPGCSDAA